MFGARRSPHLVYRAVDLESAVESASPHRLIELLFEGADRFLATADAAMARNDIAGKAEAILIADLPKRSEFAEAHLSTQLKELRD